MPESKPTTLTAYNKGRRVGALELETDLQRKLLAALGQLALTEQRLRDLVELIGAGHPEDMCDECHEMRQYYGHNDSELGKMGGWNAGGQIIGHKFFSYAVEPAALTAARTLLEPECQRDLIGNDCRCQACEERRVEAAEAAQEASEGR